MQRIQDEAHDARMLASVTPGLLYATPLLGGDAGPSQTISMLRTLVDDAWKDPEVRAKAVEIIQDAGVSPYDSWGQIRAIYNFAHSFYFVNDPFTKEALSPTRELLKMRYGDCDDINANVLPGLLGSIGFEVRLVTIAADPNMPDIFTHVYAEVFQDGNWIPLDAARPGATFGVAPARFFRRAWWNLGDEASGDYSSDSEVSMSGIGRLRGLGSISADLSAIFSGAGAALKSISGQSVQPVIGPTIGPGGSLSVTPGTGPITSSEMEIVFVLAAIGLIWWGLS